MDPRNAVGRAQPTRSEAGDPEAIDFVRFCYRRRRVGWPELYDEMCAVAGRGLYRGLAADDLGEIGVGFALDQMPGLATIVHQVVAEDHERRRLTEQAVRASYVASASGTATDAGSIAADSVPTAGTPPNDPAPGDAASADVAPRLVAAAAGA